MIANQSVYNVIVWLILLVSTHSALGQSLFIGDAAPKLEIEHWLKGEEVSDYEEGKVYVLEFWATWCGPCIANMDHLTEIQKKYDGEVVVIGVSDEPPQVAVEFLTGRYGKEQALQYERIHYRLASDPDKSTFRDFMDATGYQGIPHVFVIGKQGEIEWWGHPSKIDDVLAAVNDDRWNRESFAEEAREYQVLQQARKKLDDRFTQAMADENWDEAISALDETIAQGRIESIPVKFAILLSKARQPEKAYAYGREIQRHAWNDEPWLLYQLGWVTVGREDFPVESEDQDLDFALEVCQRSVELTKEQDANYLDMLARVYSLRANYKMAIRELSKAIALLRLKEEAADSDQGRKFYHGHVRKMTDELDALKQALREADDQ